MTQEKLAMSNREKLRILIISHDHPKRNIGGGERVAYGLFKKLQEQDDCEILFISAYQETNAIHIGVPFANYSLDGSEVLYYSGQQDFFLFSKSDKKAIWNDFRELLERFKPDVVHFHHYIYLGIELIREVRKYSSNVSIFLTLHEYLSICYNDGQMLKNPDNSLCYEAKPSDCAKCFPNLSAADFKLRELYIKSFFKLVDIFISPSKFLIDRYTKWGIPRDKMIYIENGQPDIKPAPIRQLNGEKSRNRFAFFGQILPYKGLIVLLEALYKLPEEENLEIFVDIHGGNLHRTPESFQAKFTQLLNKSKIKKIVQFHGPYRSESMPNLMAQVDWVIVPSIWWENSPLVIQEAFSHRRPIICSNIGGMAEKVEHGKTGLHFEVNNASDLSNRLVEAVSNPHLWEKFHEAIAPPPTISETSTQHLQLYKKIIKAKKGLAV
jgi:glycosyltransferase involved in cell wall biosynthesis